VGSTFTLHLPLAEEFHLNEAESVPGTM
jgi:hypothetical protein